MAAFAGGLALGLFLSYQPVSGDTGGALRLSPSATPSATPSAGPNIEFKGDKHDGEDDESHEDDGEDDNRYEDEYFYEKGD